MITSRRTLPILLVFAVSATACSGLYELPNPPPPELWHRHSLNPAQDEARDQDNFLAARDSVLTFLQLMEAANWEGAYSLLSNETRILLDDLSPDGLGETVLAEGRVVRDGAEYELDPVDLFVISDFEALLDEQPSEEEQETYRRKETFARSLAGDIHRVVLILEEDVWRIHKPSIELTPGAPGRRSPDS